MGHLRQTKALFSWFIVQVKWFLTASPLFWKSTKEMQLKHTIPRQMYSSHCSFFSLHFNNKTMAHRLFRLVWVKHLLDRTCPPGLFLDLLWVSELNPLQLCSLFWILKSQTCRKVYGYKFSQDKNTVYLMRKESLWTAVNTSTVCVSEMMQSGPKYSEKLQVINVGRSQSPAGKLTRWNVFQLFRTKANPFTSLACSAIKTTWAISCGERRLTN